MTRTVQLLPEAVREVEEGHSGGMRDSGADWASSSCWPSTPQLTVSDACPRGMRWWRCERGRHSLRRFPYYALEGERILITAVFHGRRDPRRWSDRVREHAIASRAFGGEHVSA